MKPWKKEKEKNECEDEHMQNNEVISLKDQFKKASEEGWERISS